MQVRDAIGQAHGDFLALRDRHPAHAANLRAQRAGHVFVWFQRGLHAGHRAVRQFHDVMEMRAVRRAPGVQHIHQARRFPAHWLVAFHRRELALERTLIFKRRTPYYFHRTHDAHHISRQPHFAIGPAPYQTEEFVVGDVRRGVHDL